MDDAFEYVVENGGIDTESDYAYWSSWGLPFSWCNKCVGTAAAAGRRRRRRRECLPALHAGMAPRWPAGPLWVPDPCKAAACYQCLSLPLLCTPRPSGASRRTALSSPSTDSRT
jgi:hypothetical protein